MNLRVVFEETDQQFSTEFQEIDSSFLAGFGEVQVVTQHIGGELYNGAYDVTPKVDEQSLPTKGKLLVDDVTIRSIPIFRTTNTSGGNTVYIAKET